MQFPLLYEIEPDEYTCEEYFYNVRFRSFYRRNKKLQMPKLRRTHRKRGKLQTRRVF
jgi:hypothetical protein